MHAKCMYTKCILHFDKLLYTFCIQTLAVLVLSIQNVCESLSKCGIHFVYILYAFVYVLCNFYMQNVYTICLWAAV